MAGGKRSSPWSRAEVAGPQNVVILSEDLISQSARRVDHFRTNSYPSAFDVRCFMLKTPQLTRVGTRLIRQRKKNADPRVVPLAAEPADWAELRRMRDELDGAFVQDWACDVSVPVLIRLTC